MVCTLQQKHTSELEQCIVGLSRWHISNGFWDLVKDLSFIPTLPHFLSVMFLALQNALKTCIANFPRIVIAPGPIVTSWAFCVDL